RWAWSAAWAATATARQIAAAPSRYTRARDRKIGGGGEGERGRQTAASVSLDPVSPSPFLPFSPSALAGRSGKTRPSHQATASSSPRPTAIVSSPHAVW